MTANTARVGEAGGTGLSSSDFQRLGRFINSYSGIKMPPSKRTMVEGRLRRRIHALGFTDFHRYCDFLFRDGGLDDEAAHIIDAVTTNKTEFFREPDHFRYLVETAIPARLAAAGGGATLKLWSAACATGAEAYTLAMLMDDFRSQRHLDYTVVATDLCSEVLAKAQQAIYPPEIVAGVPARLQHRYLMRSRDRAHPAVRVVPELRQKVRFGRLNLTDEDYPVDGDFDVIFCRNVLIYFEKSLQELVLSRLCAHLAPGGYLFIGHSETVTGFSLPVRQAAPTIFVKV